jgi:hypothetical protein
LEIRKKLNSLKKRIIWSVFEEVDKYFDENAKNIYDCIMNAYKISIKEWNRMSNNCKYFVKNKYLENQTSKKNLKSLEIFL